MKFEFLNEKWVKLSTSDIFLNRFQITCFEYDENNLLRIYYGEKLYTIIVEPIEFDRFKRFVISGCTL